MMIDARNPEGSAALRLTEVRKSFGSTVALDGVSLEIGRGRTHAILGENGAGKSTLVRIVSGVVRPDEGFLEVFGRPALFRSPRDARRRGIATAFQELSLVPDLTVAQNLFLGVEKTQPGPLILPRDLRRRAEELLASVQVTGVSPESVVKDLPLGDRQRIEIAKALRGEPELLLLDEPTSALGQVAMAWFYELISALKRKGVTIVFITHRMAEIGAICDTVTILRNGRVVTTNAVGTLAEPDVIRLMIGRSLQATYPPTRPQVERPVALETRSLTVGTALVDASIQLRRGEILGVAGLAGHGQRELFLSLFGMAKPDRGTIHIDGRRVSIRHPADAVAAGIGISLVPEDRKTEGLFLRLSVRSNFAIPSLASLARFGWIQARTVSREVSAAAEQVNVEQDVLEADVSSLSGGNQQKVVIGKWLLAGAKILLLYDPTRGVDIGTKAEIYGLMHDLAERGVSILFYSTELSEITHLSDRVLVLYRARVVAQLEGFGITDEAVLAAAVGRTGATSDG